MRIYTRAGDLAFKTFTFPDGQPHFKLETYEVEFRSVTIETAIKSPTDLFQVLLVSDVLRKHGYSEVLLDIRYLMAARMDRAIDTSQPFTLDLVARLLNGAGFNRIRILDVHSEVATRLIRNSKNVLPLGVVEQVRTTLGIHRVVCPDKGAENRVLSLVLSKIAFCKKNRDMATGALSGFSISNPEDVTGNDCLILDDICDGGGTFVGLAKELRKAGAKKVYLFITHAVMSKGYSLEGIDHIYTTDSLQHQGEFCCPFTVIPISMKDLKS